jgi:formate hydrogenlyase transcriptional activator
MMNVLKRHDWPGNVRELQNVIERAVVFSTDSLLRLPLMDLKQMTRQPSAWNSGTLAEAEREHIMYALKHTDGVVGGPHGAAALLGSPRTTLICRMRKLGIEMRRSHRMPPAQHEPLPVHIPSGPLGGGRALKPVAAS